MAWFHCSKCHGTGRVFSPWYAKTSVECLDCDGTGSATVNGEAARHERRLFEEKFGDLLGKFQTR